jgi:hypothetical protein
MSQPSTTSFSADAVPLAPEDALFGLMRVRSCLDSVETEANSILSHLKQTFLKERLIWALEFIEIIMQSFGYCQSSRR